MWSRGLTGKFCYSVARELDVDDSFNLLTLSLVGSHLRSWSARRVLAYSTQSCASSLLFSSSSAFFYFYSTCVLEHLQVNNNSSPTTVCFSKVELTASLCVGPTARCPSLLLNHTRALSLWWVNGRDEDYIIAVTVVGQREQMRITEQHNTRSCDTSARRKITAYKHS